MSLQQSREEELENRVEELEETVEFLKDTIWTMEDHLYGRGMDSYDAGTVDTFIEERGGVFEQIETVEGRVRKIERGEVDPGELVAESAGSAVDDLLPIHQMYLTAKNVEPEQHNLSPNQEIAARLFPHIIPAATPEGNQRLRISSPKVKDLIQREVHTPELNKRLDVENPNRNTVKRAMKFIGEFGGETLEFKPVSETGRKANEIVVDRDEWIEYEKRLGQLDSSQQTETEGGDVTLS